MANQSLNQSSSQLILQTSPISSSLISDAIISCIPSRDLKLYSSMLQIVCPASIQAPPLAPCLIRLYWPSNRILISHSSRDLIKRPPDISQLKSYINCAKDPLPDHNPVKISNFTSLPSSPSTSALIYTPPKPLNLVCLCILLFLLLVIKDPSCNRPQKLCNRRGCFLSISEARFSSKVFRYIFCCFQV